jgi:uncharacterized Zn-binding protein involved in type VI secretion
MAERNPLCVGDPPVTGGAVLPYTAECPNIINGAQTAIIGGQVLCAACGVTGTIAKKGGLRRYTDMGNEVALDGDLCMCACHPPPPIKATIATTFLYDDMGEAKITTYNLPIISSPLPLNQPNDIYWVLVKVKDTITNEPIRNRPVLVRYHGQEQFMTTNENGELTLSNKQIITAQLIIDYKAPKKDVPHKDIHGK